MFILKSKDINNMTPGNTKFGSFFEIEQVPNSRGLYEFVRWIDEGGIELSPEFQRQYVWSKQKASLLIESFLMNIPIPSIFMYIQDGKRHIIDGKQRLETIRRFIKNEWIDGDKKSEFALDENKRMDSIYYIFERLNTGGVSLTPSEIRLSIWNDLSVLKDIKIMSDEHIWQNSIQTSKKEAKENASFPGHERSESLLKIIALANNLGKYKPPMKDFLTDFLGESKKNKRDFAQEIANLKKIMNDDDIQNFLQPFYKRKNTIIEVVYTAILISQNNNVSYHLPPDHNIFKNKVFTAQGGTAQKNLVINRVKLVYNAITGADL